MADTPISSDSTPLPSDPKRNYQRIDLDIALPDYQVTYIKEFDRAVPVDLETVEIYGGSPRKTYRRVTRGTKEGQNVDEDKRLHTLPSELEDELVNLPVDPINDSVRRLLGYL